LGLRRLSPLRPPVPFMTLCTLYGSTSPLRPPFPFFGPMPPLRPSTPSMELCQFHGPPPPPPPLSPLQASVLSSSLCPLYGPMFPLRPSVSSTAICPLYIHPCVPSTSLCLLRQYSVTSMALYGPSDSLHGPLSPLPPSDFCEKLKTPFCVNCT
jgi:hypothetical protein